MKVETVWITGASSGIGKALALKYASEAYGLIITARRLDELEKVRQGCLSKGAPFVKVYSMDMSSEEEIQSVGNLVLSENPNIDILVHNAGISQRSKFELTDLKVFKKLMQINFLSYVQLTQMILPLFKKQGHGQFIVTSSLAGKFGTAYRSGYSASKHALHGFFDSIRAEHHEDNIKVTIICPGYIKTDISKNAFNAKGEAHNKMDLNQEKGMLPSVLADKVFKAVKQGKYEIYIGGKERFGVYLNRIYPRWFKNLVRKQTAEIKTVIK